MPNPCVTRMGRVVAMTVVFVLATVAQLAHGQSTPGAILPNGLLPILTTQPTPTAVSPALYQQPMSMPQRAPMARLIENPDQTDGAPPYALTDQSGTVQRYVEPVPGVDLSAHVGQVVTVRNDTGMTLLASQLELPAQPLQPMMNSSERYATATTATGAWRRTMDVPGAVQQAQYVDNDDSSVQLLQEEMPPAGQPEMMSSDSLMPLDGMQPVAPFPAYGEQVGPPGMVAPMCPPGMPMAYPPGMLGYPTVDVEEPKRTRFSADIELMMLRPQIAETATGKLSENYQFSPRIILGVAGAGNFDGRLRYWHYDRNSDVLGADGSIRIKFDVLDIEALHHFNPGKSDVSLSAGLRLAGLRLTDIDSAECNTELIGLTMAADGLTPLGEFPSGHLGLVYGARLSLLGGHWDGDPTSQFVDARIRNDNVLVNELYGGVEMARRLGMMDVRLRLLFEMQNWRSDVLSQYSGVDSIGILGPALQLGAQF